MTFHLLSVCVILIRNANWVITLPADAKHLPATSFSEDKALKTYLHFCLKLYCLISISFTRLNFSKWLSRSHYIPRHFECCTAMICEGNISMLRQTSLVYVFFTVYRCEDVVEILNWQSVTEIYLP